MATGELIEDVWRLFNLELISHDKVQQQRDMSSLPDLAEAMKARSRL